MLDEIECVEQAENLDYLKCLIDLTQGIRYLICYSCSLLLIGSNDISL